MEDNGLMPADLDIPESSEVSLTQTLSIAFYNIAVEHEFSFNYTKAFECYTHAIEYAKISVNTEHLQG
jgi:hypothetical protein